MVAQGPCAHVFADFVRPGCGSISQTGDNLLRAASHQYLLFGFKKLFDTGPTIGNHTSPGAGGLEDARRRRKTDPGHGVAIDVEHHARGTVDAIVIAGPNVTDPAYISGKPLAAPAF